MANSGKKRNDLTSVVLQGGKVAHNVASTEIRRSCGPAAREALRNGRSFSVLGKQNGEARVLTHSSFSPDLLFAEACPHVPQRKKQPVENTAQNGTHWKDNSKNQRA